MGPRGKERETNGLFSLFSVSVFIAAVIYGLDILTVQEAGVPEGERGAEEGPGGPRGAQGPPFFVEGLRAKPAVDGSLELTEGERKAKQINPKGPQRNSGVFGCMYT